MGVMLNPQGEPRDGNDGPLLSLDAAACYTEAVLDLVLRGAAT
jgi:hypothetical protein